MYAKTVADYGSRSPPADIYTENQETKQMCGRKPMNLENKYFLQKKGKIKEFCSHIPFEKIQGGNQL